MFPFITFNLRRLFLLFLWTTKLVCKGDAACSSRATVTRIHRPVTETPPAFVAPLPLSPRLLVSFSAFVFSLMVLGQTAFQRRTKWQLTVLPYFGPVWSARPLSKCILSFSREDIKDVFNCFHAMAATWQCRLGSADFGSQRTVLKATPSSTSKCACLGVNIQNQKQFFNVWNTEWESDYNKPLTNLIFT